MYYNKITGAESEDYDHSIGIFHGMSWDRPEDKERILASGWRMMEFPEPPPAGSVITGTTYVDKDAETVTKAQTWITAEQAEINRIVALAAIYGQTVAEFAYFLDIFELKMPITAAEATVAIYAAAKVDPGKDPDALMIVTIYNNLRANLSDADIYAIGKSIGVAE